MPKWGTISHIASIISTLGTLQGSVGLHGIWCLGFSRLSVLDVALLGFRAFKVALFDVGFQVCPAGHKVCVCEEAEEATEIWGFQQEGVFLGYGEQLLQAMP